jgi:RNA polymerase-binding transcription factor DksA
MDARDDLLERQRTAAVARVTSLERQLRHLADEQALTTHDDEHDPEGMTIGYQRAQFQSLLAAARAELDAIDQARKRLDDGSYGRCTCCGAAIGADRLTALPATLTCIDCARSSRPARTRR